MLGRLLGRLPASRRERQSPLSNRNSGADGSGVIVQTTASLGDRGAFLELRRLFGTRPPQKAPHRRGFRPVSRRGRGSVASGSASEGAMSWELALPGSARQAYTEVVRRHRRYPGQAVLVATEGYDRNHEAPDRRCPDE